MRIVAAVILYVIFFALCFLGTGSDKKNIRSFWYYLAIGEGLNLFDLLVIGLLWWQHSRRVRFEGIGVPEDYLGAGKHAMAFVRAVPVFAAAAMSG